SDSTIIVSGNGTYIVDVQIGNVILSDTVIVIGSDEIIDFFPLDTTLCEGDDFNVQIPFVSDFIWSTGITANEINISQGGIYGVEISNACGEWSHEFNVQALDCSCSILAPNIFSPG